MIRDSPYWLCQGFGGVFGHKHVTGKSVVCRVLGDETKIPAEGDTGRSAYVPNWCFWKRFHRTWKGFRGFTVKLCEPLAAPCGSWWQQRGRLFFLRKKKRIFSPFKATLTCCFWDGSRKMRRSSAGRSGCTRCSEEETGGNLRLVIARIRWTMFSFGLK